MTFLFRVLKRTKILGCKLLLYTNGNHNTLRRNLTSTTTIVVFNHDICVVFRNRKLKAIKRKLYSTYCHPNTELNIINYQDHHVFSLKIDLLWLSIC